MKYTQPLRKKVTETLICRSLDKMEIYSLSGLPITDISPRDEAWIKWIGKHGASDNSIRQFLQINPVPVRRLPSCLGFIVAVALVWIPPAILAFC